MLLLIFAELLSPNGAARVACSITQKRHEPQCMTGPGTAEPQHPTVAASAACIRQFKSWQAQARPSPKTQCGAEPQHPNSHRDEPQGPARTGDAVGTEAAAPQDHCPLGAGQLSLLVLLLLS